MSKPNPHSKDEKTSVNNKLTKSAAHRRDKVEAAGRRANKPMHEKEFRRLHGATLKSAKMLLDRKLALQKKKEAFAAGYFNAVKDEKFDFKQCEAELSLVDKELELARATLRAGLGDRPIHIRLPLNYSNVSSGTGLVDQATAINANGATEWSTLALLFDEFKTKGGHWHFTTAASQPSSTTDPLGIDLSFIGVSYDADSTVPGGISQISQLSQHKLYATPLVYANYAIRVYTKELEYKFHIPPGTVIPSGAASLPGTEWQTTAAPAPVGYLKVYGAFEPVSLAVVVGILYLNCEFRCRT